MEFPYVLKPLHIDNATAMRSLCDHKTDNRKESHVLLKYPIGRRMKSIASSLLSMHKRLAATDLVAPRFH